MTIEEAKLKYKYLSAINSPKDLKKLSVDQLSDVCDEVRDFMIETISQTGGHLGAGLGVVELTVAMHYVYDTPNDKIIFDVGHQGYPHKILTGRRDQLHTIRQKDGLSGFLKPAESEYDVFGAGHASTSISAALGIATARDLLKKKFRVLAVVGDGSMTGGMAFEAMNNCGVQKRDLTVILNDNNVSISPNVSALSNYFSKLYASSAVQKMRENIWEITGKMDQLGDRLRLAASRIEGSVKAIVTPGLLFEAFGFNYFGPIKGNNVRQLVKFFQSIKDVHGPILLHVMTQKGKGYAPAEQDSLYLHSIGKINVETGEALRKTSDNSTPVYSNVFGDALVEIIEKDKNVVAVTAAMVDGTGLDIVAKVFPDSIFDVGIAEQHAVTFSAGLANQGITPVCTIYSTFLQRAYDQIVHDCALQNLHVVFCIDRAGLVGEDGATHHGILDIASLRAIPNIVMIAPKDAQELRDMLYSAIYYYKDGPVAIRYPRGKVPDASISGMKMIPLGKSEVVKKGSDIAIIAYGKMVAEALKAVNILAQYDIFPEIINSRFAKPLDYAMLDEVCEKFDLALTLEDGQITGGFGSSILEYISTKKNGANKIKVTVHGIPDKFIEQGTQSELFHDLKLDAEGIAEIVKNITELNPKPFFSKILQKF